MILSFNKKRQFIMETINWEAIQAISETLGRHAIYARLLSISANRERRRTGDR